MTHVPTAPTAVALLALLKTLGVQVRAEDGRLRISAPKGRLTPDLEAVLVSKKEELLQLLAVPAERPRGALKAIPRDGNLRMSFFQERLWVLDQLQPGHTSYNLATSTGEVTPVDAAQLQKAIRRVVSRHEILRSRFTMVQNQPSVVLADANDTEVRLRDLRALPAAERAAAIAAAPAVAAHVPFNLQADAPVRFEILQTGESSAALVISAHHIATDAWSLGVLSSEIMAEYNVLAHGDIAPRAPLDVQYVDFAAWQREVMSEANTHAGVAFWLERLRGIPQLSTFVPDRPRRSDDAGTGANAEFRWSRDLYDEVRALARELDATVYMVLLAAMTVVLSRNTGQTDVAVGAPMGTRALSALEGMIGPIVNPLVLRFDIGDDPTFADLVRRARTAVLDGHTHQDVPFELLVQAVKPDRSLGTPPLFQVAVVLHNAPASGGGGSIHGGGAIYDVTLFAGEHDGGLSGSFEYRSDLYDESTIRRIDAQIQTLVRAAARNAQSAVSRLPLQSDAAIATLVRTLTPAPVEVNRATVVTQFVQCAARVPDATAVVAADETLTFAELDRRSSLVASALQAAGAGRGGFVALATDRSSAMVVGALAILKSGAAYVPVDVSYPTDRVAFMLKDSGAQHMLATTESVKSLQGIELPPSVLLVDTIVRAPGSGAPLRDPAVSTDTAYMIYTSGSTGTPKGVIVPHRALSNFLTAMQLQPGITAEDRVLGVTSMSFDISVMEVFVPLVLGGRVIVATREETTDGARLVDLIQRTGATVVQSTPSGWRLLMNAQWAGSRAVKAVAGGESMPADLAQWMLERMGQVWNGYGPTETTVYSTMSRLAVGDAITIGVPVANTRIYVMEAGGSVAPIGVTGEICIGGEGVTDGYHRRPELTAERFVPDPFVHGAVMYRTGDLGRWRTDGRLDHLGRIDGQVKLRGYRIETGEIEAELARHEMVRGAVVGVRNASADDPRLVAWVQLHEDEECTASDLRRHLRQKLPDFMIPSMIVLVERFPLTPNAKVDRKALPDPFAGAALAPREFVAPSTPTERLIAEVWTGLLGVQQVGTTDSFFELGGHSLLAMQAAREISNRTGRFIEPRLLFIRTLGQLAQACDAPVTNQGASRS